MTIHTLLRCWLCNQFRLLTLNVYENCVLGKGTRSVAGTNRCRCPPATKRQRRAHSPHFAPAAVKFLVFGRNAGQTKRPPGRTRRAFLCRYQNGASADSAAASALGVAGISASA